MKHVFVINSHTTFLSALGVVNLEKLPSSDIIFLYMRNYKNDIISIKWCCYDVTDYYNKIFSKSLLKHPLFRKNIISEIDEFLDKNIIESYHLYAPHFGSPFFQILYTNKLCIDGSYIQEGGVPFKNAYITHISWYKEYFYRFINKYLISYMKGIEKCSPKDTKCNFELDSAVNAEKGANYSRFVFADGSCFGVLIGWSNPNTAKVHGWFDYNCKAKPNKAGKDEFSFYMSFGVTSNHYTPFQYTNYYSNGKKLSDMSRNELKQLCISEPVNCGALIQYDGWRVADDYPVKL